MRHHSTDCIHRIDRLINGTMPGGDYANKSVPRYVRPPATDALFRLRSYRCLNNGRALPADHRHQLRRHADQPPTITVGWECRISVGGDAAEPGQLL